MYQLHPQTLRDNGKVLWPDGVDQSTLIVMGFGPVNIVIPSAIDYHVGPVGTEKIFNNGEIGDIEFGLIRRYEIFVMTLFDKLFEFLAELTIGSGD